MATYIISMTSYISVTPIEYMEQYYRSDYELFNQLAPGDCTCGRMFHSYSESLGKSEQRLHSPVDFVCATYEINLLNQIFYAHFREQYDTLKALLPQFRDSRCSYQSHPASVIRCYHSIKSSGEPRVSVDDMLRWDRYWIDWLGAAISDGRIPGVSIDSIVDALKSDPDCSPANVLRAIDTRSSVRK